MYANEYLLIYLVGERMRADRAAAAQAAIVRCARLPRPPWRAVLGKALIDIGHRLSPAGDARPASASRGMIRGTTVS